MNLAIFEQARTQLSTINDFLRFSVSCFTQHNVYYGHGTDNAWDEAVALVMQILHLPANTDRSLMNAALVDDEKNQLVDAIQKRAIDKLPLPYITHQAWFCDLPFYVDERVLIPRSPIAELIANHFEPWYSADKPIENILDLCTGSACIAIACAQTFDEAHVDAVDLSADALDVARINQQKFNLTESLHLYQGNLFDPLPPKRYDLIVSNPPYVDAQDMASLPDEFTQEPEMALTAGDDGLDIVKIILKQAANYLTEQGLLVVEVGNSQEALEQLMPTVPFTWIDFEFGGHGVFVLSAPDLRAHQSVFDQF